MAAIFLQNYRFRKKTYQTPPPIGDVPIKGPLKALKDLQQVHHHRSTIWAESRGCLTHKK